MALIQSIAAFLLAIIILVSLHELGHLVAARCCGIKVRRFSVGFGKPLLQTRWRNIEWCLAPVPLGGYVRMLDTREGNVPPEQERYAFDKQHPLKRIIVVLAGPLTNLVLAVLLYTFSFHSGGIATIKPQVGTVVANSIAAAAGFQAGDRIQSVNGTPIDNWSDAQTQIMLDIEAAPVRIAVQTAQGTAAERIIDIAGTPAAEQSIRQHGDIGISWLKTTNAIGMITPDSPAARAGLKTGDRITAVDGTPTPEWQDWSKIVRANAGRNLKLTVERQDAIHTLHILPDSRESADKRKITGYIGVAAATDQQWRAQVISLHYPELPQAVGLAWDKTTAYVGTTLKFLGRLISGDASSKHLSGPVAIADLAGQTARVGWQSYIEFLAVISTSLFIMNMLPIPVLDGGHLVYYTAELIRGKPLSQRIQEIGLRIGLSLMLLMMAVAFFNDITRIFG